MSTGVDRVVRSENAGINFITLDLYENAQSSTAESITAIQTLYHHCFQRQGLQTGTDSDFLLRDRLLQIPRAVMHTEKDDFVLRETRGVIPKVQQFGLGDRHLKAKLGTPGCLDSLYFAEDDSPASEIGEHEVEVEVKATGVSEKNKPALKTNLVLTDTTLAEFQRCDDRTSSSSSRRARLRI